MRQALHRRRPDRGYVGPDRFTFQGSGTGRYGAPVVRTVSVRVNVVP
ncbi:MAG TPA: hypothetical protein VHN20_17095 [Beijerinckiaceae bacterium]|nr:hypothetical protein [Beijerinckiaceae bacterium]